MSRIAWPVVVRLQHIESASVADAGSFGEHRIAPVPIPPAVSTWLATFCANTTEPVVALTFDDGPNPIHTPAILDLLAERGATATFFCLAPQVEAHPDIARRIVRDGHEIAVHGLDHRSLLTLSTREAAAMVAEARARIESVTGARVRLYRPPYGEYTWQQAARLRLMGLETVIWSGDSRDWTSDDPDATAALAVARAFGGAIILFHDHRGDPETFRPGEGSTLDRAKVVRKVLDRLDDLGYHTRQVGEMVTNAQRVRSIARYGAGTDRRGAASA